MSLGRAQRRVMQRRKAHPGDIIVHVAAGTVGIQILEQWWTISPDHARSLAAHLARAANGAESDIPDPDR